MCPDLALQGSINTIQFAQFSAKQMEFKVIQDLHLTQTIVCTGVHPQGQAQTHMLLARIESR